MKQNEQREYLNHLLERSRSSLSNKVVIAVGDDLSLSLALDADLVLLDGDLDAIYADSGNISQ